jgi:hypothetical protein
MARISFSILNKPKGKQGILKPDGQGYYEQIIGGLNIDNSADMRYTTERSVVELFNNSSTLRRKMDRGVLRGEIGHPKFMPGMSKADFINRLFQIYEENTCVQYKDIWLDNTVAKNPDGSAIWVIFAKFTPSGSKGAFLEKQLKNGNENVCFSIRSFTDDYKVAGKTHRDIVEIVTFDYVNEPGIHIAEKYKSPALEAIGRGTEVLVTQNDFEEAFASAVRMGVATESSIIQSRDQIFKQFGWKKQVKTPGYMSL